MKGLRRMIKRKALFLVLGCMLPLYADALGLRGINVNSVLNEPLNARIELVSIDGLEPSDIRASLASASAFEKAGIDRPFLLSKLRFKTIFDDAGNAYIQVTTRDSIREPFLNFLIKLDWRGGTMFREYTVLLDPPTYTPPTIAAPATVAVPAPRVSTTPRAPQARPAAAVNGNATYGPVKRSETLWVIADKTRPDSAVSVEQMMMALHKVNPHAFQHDNVNLLRAGVTLNLPQPATIDELTRPQARKAFAEHTKAWKALRAGSAKAKPSGPEPAVQPEPEPAAILPVTPEVPAEPEAQPVEKPESAGGAELRVVETTEAELARATPGPEVFPQNESEKLQAAIEDSQHELAAVEEINQNLDELRSVLEAKIEALRQSLEEKNKTIEDLKQKLETTSVGPQTTGSNEGQAMPGVEEKVAPAGIQTSVPVSQQSREPEQVESDKSGLEALLDRIDYRSATFVLIGLLALVLVMFFLRGRKRDSEQFVPDTSGAFTVSESDYESVERDADNLLEELFEKEKIEPAPAPQSQPVPEVESLSEEGKTDVASILTEADIYLAYRRYGQAEGLVTKAMNSYPDNPELIVKLLEIYAFKKDKKSFSNYFDDVHELLSHNAPDQLERAYDMARELVPDHPGLARKPNSITAGRESGLPEVEEKLVIDDDAFYGQPDAGSKLEIDDEELMNADDHIEMTFEKVPSGVPDQELDLDLDELLADEEQAEDAGLIERIDDFEIPKIDFDLEDEDEPKKE
jgi:pilus assembly protein FimV